MKLHRNTILGIWNPALVENAAKRASANRAHDAFLERMVVLPLEVIKGELGGRKLACYCKPSDACPANIL